MARGFEQHVAELCGVTKAGLRYLAVLQARGKAPQRGNEAGKLFKDGLIEANAERGSYEDGWATITDAGREVVKRARAMGW